MSALKENRSIPTALLIVAVLFLLDGIGSVLGMVIRLASGSLFFDFGVLGIPAFYGLRRFSSPWRTFALVCIWLGLIAYPLFFLFGIFGNTPANFRVLGMRMAKVDPFWVSLASVPAFLLAFWQYRVLTRPDIRALFSAPSPEPGDAEPAVHGRAHELLWLPDIEWLSPEDARRLYERVDPLQSREHHGFDPAQVRVVERVPSGTDVTAWLRRLVPAGTNRVLIVFGREEVCRLPAPSFMENWQDIFVPSRDDAVILGEDMDWVLFYCHDGKFEFGHLTG